MKKSILLSTVLLCSTIIANQNSDLSEMTELQQGVELLEATYNAAVKSYDNIKEYELNMENSIKEYMLNCAKNENNAKNLDNVKQETIKTIDLLASKTSKTEAFAITGMMFTLIFTKIMETLETEVSDQKEIDNLNIGAEEISKFIEEFFILPMQEQQEATE
ncbi:MAG: hypothetical protein ACD_82C00022G0002 [uncultured bacterium]|nr:MAG: hypothetical protein ACD_82C00022G0002 [uncultured bacterium]KKP26763.1 MAG: hypothetical protein UR12_C0036G0006 [candidate division TM6 bacterium GW2011_GWF2_30_66]